jgi:hypothetical protein
MTTTSISSEYGITVNDWADDLTDAERAAASDTALLHTRAALEQGMTEAAAVAWGTNMAMAQARAGVLRRRLVAAGAS